MKIIAVIEVDLVETPLGIRSRLADELGGRTILDRTLDRIAQIKGVAERYVLCPSAQYDRCCALVQGSGAVVRKHDAGPPPWRGLTRAARKWSLDGWRGGIGGTSCFDEYTDSRLLSGLLKSIDADAVLSLPPAAPLLDPVLADRMIEHFDSGGEGGRIGFTQAPPGVAGILLHAELVHELAEKGIPVGWVFSYKPDAPQKDLIFLSSCCPVPIELRHASGRLIADTDRAFETIAALLDDHPEPDGVTLGRWLMDRESSFVDPLPREVEIELTTDDPLPDTILRPRGSRVERRGPIDPTVVRAIVDEITVRDDALVVLGGFGDPLRHPQFAEVLEALRPKDANRRRVYGLAVRTTAVDLRSEHMDALIAHDVDVLSVTLDAWTNETYARVQSSADRKHFVNSCSEPRAFARADAQLETQRERLDGRNARIGALEQADLELVTANLDRLEEVRKERSSTQPIVLPEMTKARENVHELDDFFDGWLRKLGAVTINGYSHFAGQLPDREVIPMAPPARSPCRRLRNRCMVLADGRVVLCDQDYRGLTTLGQVGDQSLREIQLGQQLSAIRSAHDAGDFGTTPLCAACSEWHRP